MLSEELLVLQYMSPKAACKYDTVVMQTVERIAYGGNRQISYT